MRSKLCKSRRHFGINGDPERCKIPLDVNLYTLQECQMFTMPSLMLQTDVLLLATHAGCADSIHLTNSGNSASVEIGNADGDGETESALVVVIGAVVIGVVELTIVENVVGAAAVEVKTRDDAMEVERVDKLIG